MSEANREPLTTMDSRFSDPKGAATAWSATLKQLEEGQLFWVATVRPDGRPHITPAVAVWHDDALYFGTGEHEQKARNLRDNTHISLMTGRADWRQGLDIVAEGVAERVTNNERLEQVAKAFEPKWDGRWRYHVRDGKFFQFDETEELPIPVLVFAVRPTRVYAYQEGDPFSHTRHLFE
jgi:nitroimidazol reductase NimA-like FMN-containing flavoprotein (pyridoxamine 5'-phosphate oxidase superfamily)